MPFLATLLKMTTPRGRAYLTLLRADVFSIGPIGAAAQIPPTQRALALLLSERATDVLCDLVNHASPPGQLYALLGLSVSGHSGVDALLADYRHRTDEVQTQTACFTSRQPVRDIAAHIEDGTYSTLLNNADPKGH